MILIKKVIHLNGYNVLVEFNNGEEKVIDLFPFLRGIIFEPMRKDMNYFRTVHVDEELGTICWDNHADIDPDVLYGNFQPSWQDANQ